MLDINTVPTLLDVHQFLHGEATRENWAMDGAVCNTDTPSHDWFGEVWRDFSLSRVMGKVSNIRWRYVLSAPDDDGTQDIEILLVADGVVVISVSAGPYSDENYDASLNAHYYPVPEEQREAKAEELFQNELTGASGHLMDPHVLPHAATLLVNRLIDENNTEALTALRERLASV